MSGFGLIIRKKTGPSLRSGLDDLVQRSTAKRVAASAFDGDDDGEILAAAEKKAASSSSTSSILKKKAELEHAKALAEDPTVFEYDTIHDEIVAKRTEKQDEQKKADKDRKPKYVPQLLRAAKRRELEHEAREDRKQQKERVEEGEIYGDKEVFVTGAYRKRMEEVNEYQQEEDRRDEIMGRMDVTKQKDISGFYRHLLNDIARGPTIPKIKTEIEDPIEENEQTSKTEKSDSKTEDRLNKDKAYRKRKRSSSPESEPDRSESNRIKPVSKPTKKHTIYSDSSEEDRPNTPPPKKKGGLEILKKKEKVEKSRETKSDLQKRRFFTPTPPSSPEHSDKTSHKKSKKKEKSKTPEKLETPEEPEDIKPDIKPSLGVMGDVSVFGKPKNTKEQRLNRLKEIFSRKNDENMINEYRRKYFERKADGVIVPPV